MSVFMPVSINDDNFIRGAARLMVQPQASAFPTAIDDIIDPSTYVAVGDWDDLGATKTGITFSVNNTEETFDVDQVYGDIDSRPTGWEYTVSTALAEMTLERMQFAWEGSTITTGVPESSMGLGEPLFYTRRQLAILFQKQNGNIRAVVFRKVQRTPQESSIVYSKTGEQQTIAVRFRALADTSIEDIKARHLVIFDETG